MPNLTRKWYKNTQKRSDSDPVLRLHHRDMPLHRRSVRSQPIFGLPTIRLWPYIIVRELAPRPA